MRWHLFALGLAAMVLTTARLAAQEAPLPGSRTECFELVTTRPGAIPGAPMLINKCAGATYVLTRQGRPGQNSRADPRPSYAWVPVVIIDKPAKPELIPAHKGKQEGAKAAGSKKCFTYDNRSYCE